MPHDEAYYQAEKKIEQARRLGATKLDLSDMMFTELPESLGQLTQLEELNLSSNRLVTLPEWLGQLRQLKTLRLNHDLLVTVPESLGQLINLTKLELGGNKLASLPLSICNLINLIHLNVASNQLRELPREINQLKKLKYLNIGYGYGMGDNKFIGIPEQICDIYSLEILELGGCKIGKLTDKIGKLVNLKTLHLSVNNLSDIPETISHLEHLEALYLENNQLTEVPSSISQLKQLKTLTLYSNNLSDIPSSFTQIEHLELLNLDNNPLNIKLAEAYKQGIEGVKAYLRAKITPDKLSKKNGKTRHKRKLKVFLCHASQDKKLAHDLYQKFITEEWIEPWLDAKKLLPGQDWQAEIKNAVETADNVIIFLSKTSINKDGFIQKELRLAKEIALEKTEGSIFLIPLRLDNCEVPKSLQFYQWANYFGEEQEQTYSKLLESLKVRLEDIKRKESQLKRSNKGGNYGTR